MSNAVENLKNWTGESQIASLLKSNYNIELLDVSLQDKVITISTDLGKYVVKEVSEDKAENWKLVAQLYQHVGENKEAYFAINSPRITTSSQPYFNGYHHSYVLLPWIEGREFPLKELEDWGKVASALAKFHHSSKGFMPYTLFPRNSSPQPWGKTWRKLADKMEVFELAAKLTTKATEFDHIWLDKSKYVRSIFEDVLSYYDSIDGDRIFKDSLKYSRACYGNIRQRNMIQTPKGKLRLINWNNTSIDARSQDVKDLLVYAYGRKQNKDVLAQVLKSYNSTYPLKETEYSLIYAALVLPERMMALLDAAYDKQTVNISSESERILKVSKFETKKLELVRAYKDVVMDELGVAIKCIDWIHR